MPENKSWTEYFRMITPFMLVVFTFVGWTVNQRMASLESRIVSVDCKIDAVDTKLFKHLTNDEIHIPRTMIVGQEAFLTYQKMRDTQMNDMKSELREGLADIKTILRGKSAK